MFFTTLFPRADNLGGPKRETRGEFEVCIGLRSSIHGLETHLDGHTRLKIWILKFQISDVTDSPNISIPTGDDLVQFHTHGLSMRCKYGVSLLAPMQPGVPINIWVKEWMKLNGGADHNLSTISNCSYDHVVPPTIIWVLSIAHVVSLCVNHATAVY